MLPAACFISPALSSTFFAYSFNLYLAFATVLCGFSKLTRDAIPFILFSTLLLPAFGTRLFLLGHRAIGSLRTASTATRTDQRRVLRKCAAHIIARQIPGHPAAQTLSRRVTTGHGEFVRHLPFGRDQIRP